MNKIRCDVCNCNIPNNHASINQHESGKRHIKNLLIDDDQIIKPEKKESNEIRNKTLIEKMPLFRELKELFPDKMIPFLNIGLNNSNGLDVVLELFYNILLNFEEDMEISDNVIEILKKYLDQIYIIDEFQDIFLKNMNDNDFMSLFIRLLQDDTLSLNKELNNIQRYDKLNKLMEEDIDLAQQEIMANYQEIGEKYEKLYVEAKSDFIKSSKINDMK